MLEGLQADSLSIETISSILEKLLIKKVYIPSPENALIIDHIVTDTVSTVYSGILGLDQEDNLQVLYSLKSCLLGLNGIRRLEQAISQFCDNHKRSTTSSVAVTASQLHILNQCLSDADLIQALYEQSKEIGRNYWIETINYLCSGRCIDKIGNAIELLQRFDTIPKWLDLNNLIGLDQFCELISCQTRKNLLLIASDDLAFLLRRFPSIASPHLTNYISNMVNDVTWSQLKLYSSSIHSLPSYSQLKWLDSFLDWLNIELTHDYPSSQSDLVNVASRMACAMSNLFPESALESAVLVLAGRKQYCDCLLLILVLSLFIAMQQKNMDLCTIHYILKRWSSREMIDFASASSQITQSILLVCSASLSSPELIKANIMNSQELHSGITQRLKSLNDTSRKCAVYVGEALSEICKSQDRLNFDVDASKDETAVRIKDLIEVLGKIKESTNTTSKDPIDSRPFAFTKPHHPVQKESKADPTPKSETNKKAKNNTLWKKVEALAVVDGFRKYELPDSDDNDDPSDDSDDESDDPTIEHNRQKIQRPIYIRDLLRLLKSDSYESIEVAMTSAKSLIQTKRDFGGSELDDNLDDFLSTVITLKNNHDMDNFEILQSNIVSELIEALPDRAGLKTWELFFSTKISQNERLVIVGSMHKSVSALAGLKSNTSSSEVEANYLQISKDQAQTLLKENEKTNSTSQSLMTIYQERKFSRRVRDLSGSQRVVRANYLTKHARKAFIEPFCSFWWRNLRDLYGQSAVLEPYILVPLFKFLSSLIYIINQTILPPDYTTIVAELWDISLSVPRKIYIEDISVVHSVLLLILALMTSEFNRADRSIMQCLNKTARFIEGLPQTMRLHDETKYIMSAVVVQLELYGQEIAFDQLLHSDEPKLSIFENLKKVSTQSQFDVKLPFNKN